MAAPKTDKTFANQAKCGEILEPIFEKQPHHPGVAHYVIHCYDNPVLATRGLAAARMYSKIAPASAHANQMPSHIFTRMGSWGESISSNVKSAELAAKAEENSINGEARDQRLHAMDYLEYAYLQSGRVTQAKAVLDQMNALQPVAGLTLTGDIAVDGSGNAYLTGQTISTDFPQVNPISGACLGTCRTGSFPQDAFITEVNAPRNALVYSSHLGGSAFTEGFGITADSAGIAYVVGLTQSADFPRVNQIAGTCMGTCGTGGSDGFVTKINAQGALPLVTSAATITLE